MTETKTEPMWHEMKVSRQASETIRDMWERVADLTNAYGPDHKWTVAATSSLTWNITQLFGMFFGSESTITRDGELSLFVQTNSGFVYGLIFHSVRRTCVRCKTVQGYEQYNRNPDIADKTCQDGHEWDYGENDPVPGSWSFHS